MKFYLYEPADREYESIGIYFNLSRAKKDAIESQTNEFDENEPYPITIYKMDVEVKWETIANLICGRPYWKQKTEMFEIGFDESQSNAKKRLEDDND